MGAAEKLDRAESQRLYLSSHNSSALFTVLLMELQKDNDRLQREIDRLRWEVSRPDDELATKWDVATIVIALVGGLVATVAAILGVARWIAG